MTVLMTCRSDECICAAGGPEMMAGCNMSRPTGIEVNEPPRESVLDEAQRLTATDRQDAYAHPSVNFDRIARLWSVILGTEVTPEQHALCMLAVKISRLIETPGHRDSLIDLAGYARTIEMLWEGVKE